MIAIKQLKDERKTLKIKVNKVRSLKLDEYIEKVDKSHFAAISRIIQIDRVLKQIEDALKILQ